MMTRKQIIGTALLPVAVLFLSLALGACVTPSQVDELKGDIAKVRSDNQKTQQLLMRLDSMMTQQTENNDKMRNDMSYTASELQRQISTLLENYNDMMNQINQISSGGRVTHVVKSSPGSSKNTSDTSLSSNMGTPSIDCQKSYDNAFILVRQGEYEKAIGDFRNYLVECDNHQSAENARYWMGECFYSLGKFPDAIEQFQLLLDRYKGSVNSGRALYKLGRCNQELGRNEEAKKIYQQVIDKHPQTLEAEQSKERLKDIG
ncbi:MAG: tol-pal system protein YbgF [Candidatus Zixiibacteriota bacterium]